MSPKPEIPAWRRLVAAAANNAAARYIRDKRRGFTNADSMSAEIKGWQAIANPLVPVEFTPAEARAIAALAAACEGE